MQSTLYNSLQIQTVEDSTNYTSTTSEYEYTGLSVTIPKEKMFVVSGRAYFSNSIPTGVIISDSADSIYTWNVLGKVEDGCTSVTVSGMFNGTKQLYLWAKWSQPALNAVVISGFYFD